MNTLEQYGATLRHDKGKKHVDLEMNARHMFVALKHIKPEDCKLPRNQKGFKETLEPKNDPWRGISQADFERLCRGDFDMSLFAAEKKRLQPFLHELNIMLAPVAKKRKRVLSEHDGEWDYDRRWDTEPFVATHKENQPVRTVTIDVDIGLNAGIDARDIAKYGAYTFCVAQALEQAGIRCEINMITRCTYGGKIVESREVYRLKKPDEYFDEIHLARCFTPGFYRRGVFRFKYLMLDQCGHEDKGSLGYPKCYGQKSERGYIVLSPNFGDNNEQAKELIKGAI